MQEGNYRTTNTQESVIIKMDCVWPMKAKIPGHNTFVHTRMYYMLCQYNT